jgi:hypothetical protein
MRDFRITSGFIPSAATDARHDAGAVDFDIQPVRAQLHRIGAPRLDLADLASFSRLSGFVGKFRGIRLPDDGLRSADRTACRRRIGGRLRDTISGDDEQQGQGYEARQSAREDESVTNLHDALLL